MGTHNICSHGRNKNMFVSVLCLSGAILKLINAFSNALLLKYWHMLFLLSQKVHTFQTLCKLLVAFLV